MAVGMLFAALLAATPGGQRTMLPPAPREAPPQSAFACRDGLGLTAHFASRDAQLVAIVDAGNGPHTLALQPWDGGEARITWSDGVRTLTWNPGVQLLWADGRGSHLCSRAAGHRH